MPYAPREGSTVAARSSNRSTVAARKRPNWNLFDLSPSPIIIMGQVSHSLCPHENMPDACSKFGLAAGRWRNQLETAGARVATCDMPCASTVWIDIPSVGAQNAFDVIKVIILVEGFQD